MSSILNSMEQSFFDLYLNAHPTLDRSKIKIRASVAGDLATANSLLKLYVSGQKFAGSGLVEDYRSAGELLPQVGDYWIVLDSEQTPRALLRTVSVEIHRFADVPERIAHAEGEGDLTLRSWREIHDAFFTPYLRALNIHDLNHAEVVTEFFELVLASTPKT